MSFLSQHATQLKHTRAASHSTARPCGGPVGVAHFRCSVRHRISRTSRVWRSMCLNGVAAPPRCGSPWRALGVGVCASDFDRRLQRRAALDALQRLHGRGSTLHRDVPRPVQSRGALAPPQLRGRRAGALRVSSGSVQGTPTLNADAPLRPLNCVWDRFSCSGQVQAHTSAWFSTLSFSGSGSTTQHAHLSARTSSRPRACGAFDAQARRGEAARPSSSLAC